MAKSNSQGAQVSASKPMLGSYFGNHKKALSHTLNEQKKKPLASILTCAVIGIAILLPTLLGVFLSNLERSQLSFDNTTQMTVMLSKTLSPIKGATFAQELTKIEGIESAKFIHQDDALEEFKATFELESTLEHLSDNPLPHSIIVTLSDSANTIEQAQKLRTSLLGKPEIDLVQLDLMWVQRLNSITNFLSLSTWILGLMLSIAVILILGNTIRLAIENRKDEIAVLKLVGGTDAFVCRPFLYLGIFYGIGGGIFSIILCSMVLAILAQPIEALTASYQSDFSLSGLNIETTLFILLVGTFLGWCAAKISVKQHISAIEPS